MENIVQTSFKNPKSGYMNKKHVNNSVDSDIEIMPNDSDVEIMDTDSDVEIMADGNVEISPNDNDIEISHSDNNIEIVNKCNKYDESNSDIEFYEPETAFIRVESDANTPLSGCMVESDIRQQINDSSYVANIQDTKNTDRNYDYNKSKLKRKHSEYGKISKKRCIENLNSIYNKDGDIFITYEHLKKRRIHNKRDTSFKQHNLKHGKRSRYNKSNIDNDVESKLILGDCDDSNRNMNHPASNISSICNSNTDYCANVSLDLNHIDASNVSNLNTRECENIEGNNDIQSSNDEIITNNLSSNYNVNHKDTNMGNQASSISTVIDEILSTISSKYANENPKTNSGLRPVVIDGCNVAFAHGVGKFSPMGLKYCCDYFSLRGHTEICIILPQKYRAYFKQSLQHEAIYQELNEKGFLFFVRSKKINNVYCDPYDDRIIIQYAMLVHGIVVSRDHYRDIYNELGEGDEWKTIIKNRILTFFFVKNVLIFPDYPIGMQGPTLANFLKYPDT